MFMRDAALRARYSGSYANKINSYEHWSMILSRIEHVDQYDMRYRRVRDEIVSLKDYYKKNKRLFK